MTSAPVNTAAAAALRAALGKALGLPPGAALSREFTKTVAERLDGHTIWLDPKKAKTGGDKHLDGGTWYLYLMGNRPITPKALASVAHLGPRSRETALTLLTLLQEAGTSTKTGIEKARVHIQSLPKACTTCQMAPTASIPRQHSEQNTATADRESSGTLYLVTGVSGLDIERTLHRLDQLEQREGHEVTVLKVETYLYQAAARHLPEWKRTKTPDLLSIFALAQPILEDAWREAVDRVLQEAATALHEGDVFVTFHAIWYNQVAHGPMSVVDIAHSETDLLSTVVQARL